VAALNHLELITDRAPLLHRQLALDGLQLHIIKGVWFRFSLRRSTIGHWQRI